MATAIIRMEIRVKWYTVCTCKTGTWLPCLVGNWEDRGNPAMTQTSSTYFELWQMLDSEYLDSHPEVDTNTTPSGTEFRAGGSGHIHNKWEALLSAWYFLFQSFLLLQAPSCKSVSTSKLQFIRHVINTLWISKRWSIRNRQTKRYSNLLKCFIHPCPNHTSKYNVRWLPILATYF